MQSKPNILPESREMTKHKLRKMQKQNKPLYERYHEIVKQKVDKIEKIKEEMEQIKINRDPENFNPSLHPKINEKSR